MFPRLDSYPDDKEVLALDVAENMSIEPLLVGDLGVFEDDELFHI